MNTYPLQCLRGYEIFDSTVTFTQKGAKVQLEFISTYTEIKVEDDFPFLALIKIRMELEKLGVKILCNGSRIDVYPSGMGMMSLKAYELKLGEQAKKLLNIFEPTEEIDKIATIEDQRLYFENWLKSLKGNVSK